MTDEQPQPRGKDGRTYDQFTTAQRAIGEAELQIGTAYDRHLLTLASGALGLSLVFVKDTFPHAKSTGLLFGSWVAFAACIAGCLAAILFSQASVNRYGEIDRELFKSDEPVSTENRYPLIVSVLNWLGLVSFVLGVVLLFSFVFSNREAPMPKENMISPPSELKKSAGGQPPVSPPKAPPTSDAKNPPKGEGPPPEAPKK